MAALNREQKELTPLVETFHHYQGAQRELAGLTDLLSDPECRQLARAEYDQVKAQLDQLEQTLRQMLLLKGPMDGKNVFLEIRAGVGGEEAALFAADLYRMYAMYGEKQGWKLELDNVSQTELGGIKELSCLVEGESAVTLTTPLESRDYVTMTLQVLDQFGVTVQETASGYRLPLTLAPPAARYATYRRGRHGDGPQFLRPRSARWR